MHKLVHLTDPDAEDIYFDDSNVSFTADDVQEAIEKLENRVAVSASPGFTWGASGNVNANAWLLNDTVPSNLAGRLSPVTGFLDQVFFACENTATASVGIYRRDGASFTLLSSVNITAARTEIVTGLNVAIFRGDELACRLVSGSLKNPVVGVIIRGDLE